MIINFLVNPVFNGWEPTDPRLGGTEESVVQWAEELCKRGHLVNVYRNGRSDERNIPFGNFPCYLPRDEKIRPADITINVKSSDIQPQGPTLYLTNETNASDLDLSMYDAIIWPSRWAKENIPVNNPHIEILPHGFDNRRIFPGRKVKNQCFYASSPDRGLEDLLRMWPKIQRQVLDASLIVTYGGEYRSGLNNVFFLGEMGEEDMDILYQESDFWMHPASGGELYCMTGIKAQAAECIPIYYPTMALAETVRHGISCTPENYVESAVAIMQDASLKAKIRAALRAEKYPDWKASTDKLERIIQKYV